MREIRVLDAHLADLVRVLNDVYGYHSATDVREGYRNTGKPPRQSNLTRAVDSQIERFKAYLEQEEVDDEQ